MSAIPPPPPPEGPFPPPPPSDGGQQGPPPGGYPQGGYPPYQGGQYPPPQQPFNNQSPFHTGPPENKAANFAMWFGIFGCCGPLSIAAVVLGFIGRSKAKELGGEGQGKATAGLVLGFIWMAVSLISSIIYFTVVIDEARKELDSQRQRSGAAVRLSDISVTSPEIVVSPDGSVTFTTLVRNLASEDNAYELDVKCESNAGDERQVTENTRELDTLEEQEIIAQVAFPASDSLFVECGVVSVRYQ